jgi:Tfp pilus assembly protein PilO
MSASNRLIVSILAIAAVAIAFWMMLLGPKREEADELGAQADTARAALAEAQSKAAGAEAARREFPADYRQLVVLGKAVPESDETSSLLVELNHVASRSRVRFQSLVLTGSGEISAPVSSAEGVPAIPTPPSGGEPSGAVQAAATVPPTEAAASILPLGANIGPAGLAVMPYNLAFTGNFFHVADFIQGIDGMVHTGGARVAVDGRLLTLDGFALNADDQLGFPHLRATFVVTTYVTPPGEGVTAGATPAEPAPETATPASTEPAPEEAAPEEASPSSETVSAR